MTQSFRSYLKRIEHNLSKLFSYEAFALEALFPSHCIACNQDGAWVCSSCMEKIELTKTPPTPLIRGETLDGLVAVGFYHDPLLRDIIQKLKYHSATCLSEAIEALVKHFGTQRSSPWPWAGESCLAVQAVIGAENRIRARGFDQAELIRDILIKVLIPWAGPISYLSRGESAYAQADIDVGPFREANTRGVFSYSPLDKGELEGVSSAVILVDDVYTTGATMNEAARVLRNAGAERVYGFVLALGK